MSGFFGSNGKNRVQTQGLVTMNAGSGEAILQHRKDQQAAGKAVFGANGRGMSPLQQQEMLAARPWTLAMIHRGAGGKNAAMRPHLINTQGGLLQPFTNFNLAPKQSAEQNRADYVPCGFVCDYHVFGELAQNHSGLALLVHGSFPALNTGLTPWQPGDLLCWKPYDQDDDRADVQGTVANIRRAKHYVSSDLPEGYYPPMVVPFQPQDMLRDALARSVRSAFQTLPINFSQAPDATMTRARRMLASDLVKLAVWQAVDLRTLNDVDWQRRAVLALYSHVLTPVALSADSGGDPSVNTAYNVYGESSLVHAADLLYEATQTVVGVSGSATMPAKMGVLIN